MLPTIQKQLRSMSRTQKQKYFSFLQLLGGLQNPADYTIGKVLLFNDVTEPIFNDQDFILNGFSLDLFITAVVWPSQIWGTNIWSCLPQGRQRGEGQVSHCRELSGVSGSNLGNECSGKRHPRTSTEHCLSATKAHQVGMGAFSKVACWGKRSEVGE